MALYFEDNLKFAVEVGFRRVAACVVTIKWWKDGQ